MSMVLATTAVQLNTLLSTRIANFALDAYTKQGIKAQCVWYVRGRSIEKLSYNPGITGNANVWFEKAVSKKLPTGRDIESDSIACFNNGQYGHVIYIEKVIGGDMWYTEANANADNALSADDGMLKRTTVAAFKQRKGYQGCIYVGRKSKKNIGIMVEKTPAKPSTTAKYEITLKSGTWCLRKTSSTSAAVVSYIKGPGIVTATSKSTDGWYYINNGWVGPGAINNVKTVSSTGLTTTTTKPAAVSYAKGSAHKVTKLKYYSSATSKTPLTKTFTGTIYLYDGKAFGSGRYRFTTDKSLVGKTPVGKCVTGYIDKKDIK